MKTVRLQWIALLTFFGALAVVQAQERTIVGGTVLDAETMLPIPDVYIITNNDRVIAATDSGGYFEVRLTEDVYLLEFRHVAYRSRFFPLRVAKRQGQMLVIELKPRVIALPEIPITERIDRLYSLDERNTYAVIRSEQIENSRVANFQQLIVRLAPSAGMMYTSPGLLANQRPPLLYLNGIRTEWYIADLIDVHTIERVLIWRTVESPLTYRSETSRFLIDIRTKHK
jgi:hypothetical protein